MTERQQLVTGKQWKFIEVLKSESKRKQTKEKNDDSVVVRKDIRKHYEQVLEPNGGVN